MEACCIRKDIHFSCIPVIRWPQFLWLRLKLCLGCCCWDELLQTDGYLSYGYLMSSAFFPLQNSSICISVLLWNDDYLLIIYLFQTFEMIFRQGCWAWGTGCRRPWLSNLVSKRTVEPRFLVSLFTSSSVVKQSLRWLIWGKTQGSF